MISIQDVQDKLAAVSEGDLPVWSFYDWIELYAENMHRDSSEEAQQVVGEIKHFFAEYDLGLFNEQELTNRLRMKFYEILPNVIITADLNGAGDNNEIIAGSSNSQILEVGHLDLPEPALA